MNVIDKCVKSNNSKSTNLYLNVGFFCPETLQGSICMHLFLIVSLENGWCSANFNANFDFLNEQSGKHFTFNPITGRGRGSFDPPSGLFKIALKSFELLTYKLVTFPKYEFNTFSQKCSSI